MKPTTRLLLTLMAAMLVTLPGCGGQPEKNQALRGAEDEKTLTGIKNATDEVVSVPTMITKAEFLSKVMNYEKNTAEWVYEGNLPCIVDFYADWCPPCKVSNPILEELAKTYAGRLIIYKVDVDVETELASVFEVQSIPTFLFCPLKGEPTISSGIASTTDATRAMFIKQIESILLQTPGSSL